MPSLSGLPYPVAPQKQSIFYLPNVSHSGSLLPLFLPSFSHAVPVAHGSLDFIWDRPQIPGSCTLQTRFTFVRLTVISPLSRTRLPYVYRRKNPNFCVWVLRFSTTLPFGKDSPLFSAPARLVHSLFLKICFMHSHHHALVHTIPPDKNTFLLSLFYLANSCFTAEIFLNILGYDKRFLLWSPTCWWNYKSIFKEKL